MTHEHEPAGHTKEGEAHADESVSVAAPTVLVVQPHGGALRQGGKPGNKGGTGRPKERFRRRMRRILGKSLAALERDLDAHAAGLPGTLADNDGVRGGPLTRADVQKTAELAAKYGLGREDTKEVKEQSVRYVVRFPSSESDVPLALPPGKAED